MNENVKSVPLFKDMAPAILSQLLQSSVIRKYAANETILEYGEPGYYLGVVLDGKAEAGQLDADGKYSAVGPIAKGEYFGEMSLMTGEPTSARVIAAEPSEILLIPADTFTTMLITNPTAVKHISKTIADRLRRRKDDACSDKENVRGAWRANPDPFGLALRTPTPMKLLVVNSGSSSLKYSLFDTGDHTKDMSGIIERIGGSDSVHSINKKSEEIVEKSAVADHVAAFGLMVAALTDPKKGGLKDLAEIGAVGHRVVHGGDKYAEPVAINDAVIKDIDACSALAPLHNPANVMGIRESVKAFPKAIQVAVFDTAFHRNMPDHAQVYGLPLELFAEKGVKRYGFHGVSHNFVALKAAEHLKKKISALRIITCHLGNGASVCAVDHGRSVDTSMGMTPTEGLLMGTRCGDMDPSIVLHLQRTLGLDPKAVAELMDKKGGLKGVSGVSNDMREIEEAASKGDRRAILAIRIFCHRVTKYIGAYAAIMGGIDAVVFTGGIGSGSAGARASICQGLGYMGIILDNFKNRAESPEAGEVAEINEETSPAKALVIPTDEERMIARETIRALGFKDIATASRNWNEMPFLVEVSAHHVHISRSDMEKLFGPGVELTVKSYLSQPGEFASNEMLNLIGPKGTVERVRILGPNRKETQVEISITDEFKLGINAPLRASGKIDGTPGITLEGPKGRVTIEKGVICALRHIHMTPEDAFAFGLRDRDMVRVRVESTRPLIFGEVLVRVDPNYKLSMHLDTDEANAAEITTGMKGFLDGIHDRV